MSHWNYERTKSGQTVLVVICGELKNDLEAVNTVYAIPVNDGSDSGNDESAVDAGTDDYVYIDVEECAQA